MFRKFLRKLPRIAALLCALFTAFSFAACKPSGYGDHVHVGGTATCTERAKCEICDAEYGVLAAHTFGAWVEETPANCSVQGTKGHKDCTVCRKHVLTAYGTVLMPFRPLHGTVCGSFLHPSAERMRGEHAVLRVANFALRSLRTGSGSADMDMIPVAARFARCKRKRREQSA